MFPAFHPFLGLDIAWVKALIFLTSPYSFLFLCPWPSWLWILPYHFIVLAIALPIILLLVTPWVYELMLLPCQPISLSIFYSGPPWSNFHIFTFFGLYWLTFMLCQLISLFHSSSFLSPSTSSLPLLLSWDFC